MAPTRTGFRLWWIWLTAIIIWGVPSLYRLAPRRRALTVGLVAAVMCLVAGVAAPGSRSVASAASSSVPQIGERDWVAVTEGLQPLGGVAMAYDMAHEQTVLFGSGDRTWVFDSGSLRWSPRFPLDSPHLVNARMAYDADHGNVVLFGSITDVHSCDPASKGETWTWNGSTWTRQHPTVSPSECAGAGATAMALDQNGWSSSRRVILTSALPGQTAAETWAWDGANWTFLNADGVPGAPLASDTAGRVLSFGGTYANSRDTDLGETRELTRSQWTTLSHGGGLFDPSPRGLAAMAHTNLGEVVFGGVAHSPGPHAFGDTWQRIHGKWFRMGTRHSPPPTVGGLFVFDTNRGIGVLFARDTGTWILTAGHAGGGYLICTSDGGVFTFGDAHFYGSTGNLHLNQPVVGIARTPTRAGYWLAARDGGVFAFGDARFYGSTGNLRLKQPIVGIAASPSGLGYWLVARDGGVFAFGDAHFYGSTGNIRLKRPIVGMAAQPGGEGYWLTAADGGIFSFGAASFWGSTSNLHLSQPVVGIASNPAGDGYWLVARDGGVFTFGATPFNGSVVAQQPVVAIAGIATNYNYQLFGVDGSVYPVGNAPSYGTLNRSVHAPVVGAIST